MKTVFNGLDYCYWSMLLLSVVHAVPVARRSAPVPATDEYDDAVPTNATVQGCFFEGNEYLEGQTRPSINPCETCTCSPPVFKCRLRTCDIKPGCKAIQLAGKCCPTYICDCQKNGRTYGNGEKVEEPNPCNVCYCRGGEIKCAGVTCYTRSDCQPHYVPGKCCPKYDHCPPIETPDRSTSPAPPPLAEPNSEESHIESPPSKETDAKTDAEVTSTQKNDTKPPQVGTLEIIEVYPDQEQHWPSKEEEKKHEVEVTPETPVDSTLRTTEATLSSTVSDVPPNVSSTPVPTDSSTLKTTEVIQSSTVPSNDGSSTTEATIPKKQDQNDDEDSLEGDFTDGDEDLESIEDYQPLDDLEGVATEHRAKSTANLKGKITYSNSSNSSVNESASSSSGSNVEVLKEDTAENTEHVEDKVAEGNTTNASTVDLIGRSNVTETATEILKQDITEITERSVAKISNRGSIFESTNSSEVDAGGNSNVTEMATDKVSAEERTPESTPRAAVSSTDGLTLNDDSTTENATQLRETIARDDATPDSSNNTTASVTESLQVMDAKNISKTVEDMTTQNVLLTAEGEENVTKPNGSIAAQDTSEYTANDLSKKSTEEELITERNPLLVENNGAVNNSKPNDAVGKESPKPTEANGTENNSKTFLTTESIVNQDNRTQLISKEEYENTETNITEDKLSQINPIAIENNTQTTEIKKTNPSNSHSTEAKPTNNTEVELLQNTSTEGISNADDGLTEVTQDIEPINGTEVSSSTPNKEDLLGNTDRMMDRKEEDTNVSSKHNEGESLHNSNTHAKEEFKDDSTTTEIPDESPTITVKEETTASDEETTTDDEKATVDDETTAASDEETTVDAEKTTVDDEKTPLNNDETTESGEDSTTETIEEADSVEVSAANEKVEEASEGATTLLPSVGSQLKAATEDSYSETPDEEGRQQVLTEVQSRTYETESLTLSNKTEQAKEITEASTPEVNNTNTTTIEKGDQHGNSSSRAETTNTTNSELQEKNSEMVQAPASPNNTIEESTTGKRIEEKQIENVTNRGTKNTTVATEDIAEKGATCPSHTASSVTTEDKSKLSKVIKEPESLPQAKVEKVETITTECTCRNITRNETNNKTDLESESSRPLEETAVEINQKLDTKTETNNITKSQSENSKPLEETAVETTEILDTGTETNNITKSQSENSRPLEKTAAETTEILHTGTETNNKTDSQSEDSRPQEETAAETTQDTRAETNNKTDLQSENSRLLEEVAVDTTLISEIGTETSNKTNSQTEISRPLEETAVEITQILEKGTETNSNTDSQSEISRPLEENTTETTSISEKGTETNNKTDSQTEISRPHEETTVETSLISDTNNTEIIEKKPVTMLQELWLKLQENFKKHQVEIYKSSTTPAPAPESTTTGSATETSNDESKTDEPNISTKSTVLHTPAGSGDNETEIQVLLKETADAIPELKGTQRIEKESPQEDHQNPEVLKVTDENDSQTENAKVEDVIEAGNPEVLKADSQVKETTADSQAEESKDSRILSNPEENTDGYTASTQLSVSTSSGNQESSTESLETVVETTDTTTEAPRESAQTELAKNLHNHQENNERNVPESGEIKEANEKQESFNITTAENPELTPNKTDSLKYLNSSDLNYNETDTDKVQLLTDYDDKTQTDEDTLFSFSTADANTTFGYEISENETMVSEPDNQREHVLSNVKGAYPRQEAPEKIVEAFSTEPIDQPANSTETPLSSVTASSTEDLVPSVTTEELFTSESTNSTEGSLTSEGPEDELLIAIETKINVTERANDINAAAMVSSTTERLPLEISESLKSDEDAGHIEIDENYSKVVDTSNETMEASLKSTVAKNSTTTALPTSLYSESSTTESTSETTSEQSTEATSTTTEIADHEKYKMMSSTEATTQNQNVSSSTESTTIPPSSESPLTARKLNSTSVGETKTNETSRNFKNDENEVPKKQDNTAATLAEILLKWLESKNPIYKTNKTETARTFGHLTDNQTSPETPVSILSALTSELIRIVQEDNVTVADNRTDRAEGRSLDIDIPEESEKEQSLEVYSSDIENLAEALANKDPLSETNPRGENPPFHIKYPYTDENLAPVLSMISDQLQFLKVGEEQPIYIEPPPEEVRGHKGIVVVPTSEPESVDMVKVIDGRRPRGT